MRRILPLLAVVALSAATPAFGKFWEQDCFDNVVTKKAMLRKYDYKYNWGSSDTITKGKDKGSSHVTSQWSTQGTTAGVDPGYTTGYSQAEFMSTSSKKPCNYLGDAAKLDRDEFVAKNGDDLKRDIARGEGASLKAVAVLSGCGEAVLPRFYETVRSRYDQLAPLSPEKGELAQALDGVISGDQVLAQGCLI